MGGEAADQLIFVPAFHELDRDVWLLGDESPKKGLENTVAPGWE